LSRHLEAATQPNENKLVTDIYNIQSCFIMKLTNFLTETKIITKK